MVGLGAGRNTGGFRQATQRLGVYKAGKVLGPQPGQGFGQTNQPPQFGPNCCQQRLCCFWQPVAVCRHQAGLILPGIRQGQQPVVGKTVTKIGVGLFTSAAAITPEAGAKYADGLS